MDIYILRSGKEVGPLSEASVQTLLAQGTILLNDPAWRPGMAQWSPLHSVLYPQASPAHSQRTPDPDVLVSTGSKPPAASSLQPVSTGPVPQTRIVAPLGGLSGAASGVSIRLALAKQKAFLSFMGVAFPPDLTLEQAAALTRDTTEYPDDPQRLALWNAERLRLHPDLFAEEIQEMKENRANVFLQVIQNEGVEFFSKVTKAHCQVLIAALDARFPSWDAGDPEKAAWKYVFPALAEKFPHLVADSAKGKFNFPGQSSGVPRQGGGGARVRMAAPKATPKRTALGAVLRGLVWGGVILAGLYFSQDHLQPWMERIQHGIAQALVKASKPTPVSSGQPVSVTASGNGVGGNKAGKNKAADAVESSPQGGPVTTSDAAKARAPQPSAPVEAAPAAALSEPPVGASKAVLSLTKPAEVQLAFGKVLLQPGTQLKFIASEGDNVRVLYGNDAVVLPASSTDYVAPSGAAAAPAKPAVSPNSLF